MIQALSVVHIHLYFACKKELISLELLVIKTCTEIMHIIILCNNRGSGPSALNTFGVHTVLHEIVLHSQQLTISHMQLYM